MGESTRQELLRRAAHLMGRTELAIALKVPQHLLDAWISGHALMPDRKFVTLADILDQLSRK